MPSLFVPRLKILTAAFLFSTGGMAVKSCTLTGWQVTAFRCALGAVAMLVLLPSARRRWTWPAVLVGVAYAGALTLYVFANKTTTSANAVFLSTTGPLYILLLAPWLLDEQTRLRDVVVMAGMALGLVCFFLGDQVSYATAPSPVLGNVLGAGSGVCWAFTIMGLRWMERSSSPEGAPVAVVAGNAISALVALPFAFPVVSSQPTDWLWIFYLGFFQIALAYVLLTTALGAVPALEASLLILVEPTFNPLWSYWVHGEIPGRLAVVGGGLILTVTVVKSLWDAYRPVPAAER